MDTTPHHADGPDGSHGARSLAIARQIAEFVASALSEGWAVEDGDAAQVGYPTEFLSGPDGTRLRIDLERGRVRIRGIYPPLHLYDVVHCDITVARDRGPAMIAAEITRRLLGRYLPEMDRVRATNLAWTQQATARQTLIQALRTLLDSPDDVGQNWEQGRIRIRGDGGPYGHVDLDEESLGTIYMSRVPASLVLAIAELIATSGRPDTTAAQ